MKFITRLRAGLQAMRNPHLLANKERPLLAGINHNHEDQLPGNPRCTVGLRPAANGMILEVGTFKPNPHGPDWTYTHHLVMHGDDPAAAVTSHLVATKLRGGL